MQKHFTPKLHKRGATGRGAQWPAGLLAAIDVVIIALCLCVFALFDHVIPQPMKAVSSAVSANLVPAPTPLTETDASALAAFIEAAATDDAPDAAAALAGSWGEKYADHFTGAVPVITDTSYTGNNLSVTVSKHTDTDLTYFVQDIYIANIECLRTAFAKDTFGKAITESVVSMANRNGAIAAINADYYGYGSDGIVIRNGELYRDSFTAEEDVLVLFRDGTMQVYPANGCDIARVMAQGAWQAWSFGPSLLDESGNLFDSYTAANHDPRTMIGMYEPGHYAFVVVDGRQGSYSEGLTYRGLAELAHQMGLKVAYNLDGGRTSQMTFGGNITNQPYKDGRNTSDIVYVADIGQ